MVNGAFEMEFLPDGRFQVLDSAFSRVGVAVRSIIAACTGLVLGGKDISTFNPTILTGDNFRGDSVLVRTVRESAM